MGKSIKAERDLFIVHIYAADKKRFAEGLFFCKSEITTVAAVGMTKNLVQGNLRVLIMSKSYNAVCASQ